MKEPVKPRKPARPSKPKAPKEVVEYDMTLFEIHSYEQNISLPKILERARECAKSRGVKSEINLENFNVRIQAEDYDDCAYVDFYTKVVIDNPHYESEKKKYPAKLKAYEKKYAKYKIKLEQYWKELQIFDTDLKKYNALIKKKEIRELETKLKQLKSA